MRCAEGQRELSVSRASGQDVGSRAVGSNPGPWSKTPDQDPREASLGLGQARRCWLSCGSGSTRLMSVPHLTPRSRLHPVCAPEAPLMASAFSATGDTGMPEAVAPVIVVPPSNRSVVAGSSETTLECIANAR